MKRHFLGTASALAAALWIGGSGVGATAQSLDAATDSAASATTDAGSAASDAATGASTDAAASTDTADTAASTTSGASTSADAATSTGDTNASISGQADTQSSSNLDAQSNSIDATASQDASADASATAPPTPASPSPQADASADVNANVGASAGAASAENNAPGAASTDVDASLNANPNADIDASVQGDANLRAGSQAGARTDLSTGLQFGQATDRGLAINTIAQDHFFYDSGLRRGDVLVSYGGRPIRSHADFNRWAVYQPGQRVPVVVLRDGRPQTIYVVYREQHGVQHQAGYAPSGAYLGVTFDSQNPQQAVVRTVAPGSPAEQAGVRAGDAIVAVNGNRVGGSQDVIRIVQSMQPGQAIDVAVSRQVVLGSRPGVAQAGYAPDVRIQGSTSQTTAAPPAVPVPATPPAATAEAGAYVGANGAIDSNAVPGSDRYDNTPARAGDSDRDGRVLDGDGRVGPAEGRAILPRRRN